MACPLSQRHRIYSPGVPWIRNGSSGRDGRHRGRQQLLDRVSASRVHRLGRLRTQPWGRTASSRVDGLTGRPRCAAVQQRGGGTERGEPAKRDQGRRFRRCGPQARPGPRRWPARPGQARQPGEGAANGSGKITREVVPAATLDRAANKAAPLDGVAETVLAQLRVDSADPDWAGQLRQGRPPLPRPGAGPPPRRAAANHPACRVPKLRPWSLTCSFVNQLVIFMPPASTRWSARHGPATPYLRYRDIDSNGWSDLVSARRGAGSGPGAGDFRCNAWRIHPGPRAGAVARR